MTTTSPYLTAQETADALGIRLDSLARKRRLGTAPAHVRLHGGYRYLKSAVKAYKLGVPEKEACKILKVHRETLAQWRREGKGPKFTKVGRRVFYDRASLRIPE
jgi:hypothetical protein